MWFCPRQTKGLTSRREVPGVVHAALVNWYSGQGSEADHRASVTLIVTARENHQWIACDCLGDTVPPPLMSAAYLSIAETYYLRRLTSKPLGRPEHAVSCPFFRPQAPFRLRDTGMTEIGEIAQPEELFNAHRLAPEKLAQEPDDDEPDDRSRGAAIPLLARLMWWLLDRAKLDIIEALPETGTYRPSINDQFAALARATDGIQIAPGVPLSRHLYFHPKALSSNRIYAALRRSLDTWPSGFAPQAFLLAYANDIQGQTISRADGDFEIRNRIQYATMNAKSVGGPYLTLTVIGEHSKKEGYLPLRAYAQPIHAGNRLLAVHSPAEREAIEQLISLQYRLRRGNAWLTVKKPLFDTITKKGPIRPDIVAAVFDHETGEEREWAIQVLSSAQPNYLTMRDNERRMLETLGSVISLSAQGLASNQLERTILNDLGRS
jgi:hypothetical protein